MIDRPLLAQLYRKADAARWSVPEAAFHEALLAGLERAFPGPAPSRREVERHLGALHLQDLALACACAAADEAAWDHFVAEHRPVLYRAADALDRSGGARQVADELYAELYGLKGDRAERVSLFRYFHGRSSLSTWVRAVLAQRYVDRVRAGRRAAPLDEERMADVPAAQPDRDRSRFAALVGRALHAAIARLEPKDRLRLRAYYEQDLTLAQVGRLTGEHEATVSRQLARTRKALRRDAERDLRDARMTDAEIARCLQSLIDDAGPLDLRELFGSEPERKIRVANRSE
jgi:RNA polymerase sigma-70 factor